MAVLGFIFLVLISFYGTLGYFLICANGLGQYNIGGVPNKLSNKILILIGLGLIGAWWWCVVFPNFPFTVTLTA